MLPRQSQMTRITEMNSINRLNRVDFYLDDWEDRINFEVIGKCSQTTETIDQDDQRLSEKSSLSFDLYAAEVENNSKMFESHMCTF